MNGAESSRVQEHSFTFQGPSAADDQISTLSDELKGSENIVHRPIRMLRRFPEESGEELVGHRQTLLPTSETTCICPEVLSKGTLVAIIGSLAFLGFFSTMVLLLVAVIILRLMDKQWKKEKKERKDKKDTDGGPNRSLPPIPRRPSEPVYVVPRASSKYTTMRSVNQTAEGSYLDPKELHPGPRIRQEGKYASVERRGAETKSPPEKAYTSMHAAPGFSTSTPEKAYTSMHATPGFSTSTPENAYAGVQRAPVFSIPSPEHVYASIHRSQAEPSYANMDEPHSESMADASFATEEQTKGFEEHTYEEVN